jgi:hypothetical protein
MHLMTARNWLALALACAPASLHAQDPASPRTRFATITAQFKVAQSAFSADYSKAANDEQRERAMQTWQAKSAECETQLRALAKECGRDPLAVECLVWVIENTQPTDGSLLTELRQHLDSDLIGRVCSELPDLEIPGRREFLRAALEQSPHAEVRGQACYALAKALKSRADIVRRLRGSEAQAIAEALEQAIGKEATAELRATDPATIDREIEELLEQVVAKYATVPGKRKPLGDYAKGELFELRHLAVGKVAPDIVGEDVDGVPFKLSDYRGKVIFLDFWGFW